MLKKVKIAAVQMDSKILEKEYNLEKIIGFSRQAAENGAKIVVFPECALTGYCYSNVEEVSSMVEDIPGPSTEALIKICKEADILILVGLIEKDGDRYFNSAALLGSEGVIGNFRKIHLPFLGLDRFVNKGDIPFRVYETKYGKIGWLICFDGSFPEPARVLALKGAEVVALLTNWAVGGSETTPKYIIPARAIENRINFVAANRVGEERGFRFIGQSKIVDYIGNILAEQVSLKEDIVYAEVDLEGAREKRTVIIPGEYELDRFKQRSPEFYGPIVDEKYVRCL